MSEELGSSELLLVRHSYDDQSYIDGKYDASLTSKGIDIAQTMARQMVVILGDKEEIVVAFHTSSKKRCVETAEIVCEELDKSKIPHLLRVDDNLRELYQGRIINIDGLSHQERVTLLQLAWELFDEKRVAEDSKYHFGDPIFESDKYNPLSNFIKYPYGESQDDFSIRASGALSDILQTTSSVNNLPVIITHRGGIREIQNLLFAINNHLPIQQSQVCEMAGLKYCEIIDIKIDDVNFCIQAISRYQQMKATSK